jgi:hypothetical protein
MCAYIYSYKYIRIYAYMHPKIHSFIHIGANMGGQSSPPHLYTIYRHIFMHIFKYIYLHILTCIFRSKYGRTIFSTPPFVSFSDLKRCLNMYIYLYMCLYIYVHVYMNVNTYTYVRTYI